MTENNINNIKEIMRILKYIDKGKLDISSWPNSLELYDSLVKLLRTSF